MPIFDIFQTESFYTHLKWIPSSFIQENLASLLVWMLWNSNLVIFIFCLSIYPPLSVTRPVTFFFILVIWVRSIDNQINYRLVNYVLRDMIVFCVTYECSSRHTCNKGCGLLVLSSFLKKIECEEICVKFLSLKGFYK